MQFSTKFKKNYIVAEYWPTQETAKSTISSFRTRAKTTPTTVNTQSLEISEDMTFIIVNIHSHPNKNRVTILGMDVITHTQIWVSWVWIWVWL